MVGVAEEGDDLLIGGQEGVFEYDSIYDIFGADEFGAAEGPVSADRYHFGLVAMCEYFEVEGGGLGEGLEVVE